MYDERGREERQKEAGMIEKEKWEIGRAVKKSLSGKEFSELYSYRSTDEARAEFNQWFQHQKCVYACVCKDAILAHTHSARLVQFTIQY